MKQMNKIETDAEDRKLVKTLAAKHKEPEISNNNFMSVLVNKPWGYEYLLYSNENIAIWFLKLDANQLTSLHCHIEKITSMILLEGKVKISGLKNSYEMGPGEFAFIEKEAFHSTLDISGDHSYLIEIETPNKKLDLLRYRDSYGRENLGYEKENSFTNRIHNHNYVSIDDFQNNGKSKKSLKNLELIFVKDTVKNLQQNLNFDIKDECLFVPLKSSKKSFDATIGNIVTADEFTFIVKNGILEDHLEFLQVKHRNIHSGAMLIVESIVDAGVKFIYATLSSDSHHVLDILGKNEEIELLLFENDLISAIVADAISRYSNEVQVIFVGSSLGSLRILESISNSYTNNLPLIIFCAYDENYVSPIYKVNIGNKNIPIRNFFKPIVKKTYKISSRMSKKKIKRKIKNAFKNVRYGPVLILVSKQVQTKVFNT